MISPTIQNSFLAFNLPPITSRPRLSFFRAADVPKRAVQWLWPGRISLGKVTLLVGDPGLGKSLVALDIAARVTRAAPWPDEPVKSLELRVESPNHISGPPLSALDSRPPASAAILSAEDDLSETIRPRLEAHAADCERIFVLPSLADLRNDFAELQAAIQRLPDCRLLVIDPINAYVGPNDSHFHTVVGKILAPLAQFAAANRMAVLAVTHLRKHDGAAIYRATGSMGFVAAARAVWTVCRDRNTPGRHLLLPLKNNLAPSACGLAYTIEPHPNLPVPILRWHPDPIDISADEALGSKSRGPEAEDQIAAAKWLQTALAAGPKSASHLLEEGNQRGFESRTLRRALHAIGGHTEKRGIFEGWWWTLPQPAATGKSPDPEKLVPFGEFTQ
jgi:hypothetical protein